MKGIFSALLIVICNNALANECVVLLHGLARSAASLEKVATHLEDQGYGVANIDYPSREGTIEHLADEAVERGILECNLLFDQLDHIHFVTHSMGGILIRYYLSQQPIDKLGKVVMLAPPNNGSEVVDALKDVPLFDWVNGEAGLQLGTDPETSVPLSLGKVDFPLGVIAGSSTFNPILSLYLPNPDDGKVSAESTKVAGMADFILLPVTHTFMMRDGDVIAQIIHFLRNGTFNHTLLSD